MVLGVDTGREVWGRWWIRIGFAKEKLNEPKLTVTEVFARTIWRTCLLNKPMRRNAGCRNNHTLLFFISFSLELIPSQRRGQPQGRGGHLIQSPASPFSVWDTSGLVVSCLRIYFYVAPDRGSSDLCCHNSLMQFHPLFSSHDCTISIWPLVFCQ